VQYRPLGSTGYHVSEIALGGWQIGGKWGEDFDVRRAQETVKTAVDMGVNFIDTADVYDGGKSEHAIAEAVRTIGADATIATKCGRRLSPHVAAEYTPEAIRGFVDDSLKNMGMTTLDIIQLHCPPTEVYYRPEIFDALDELKREGKVAHYGVSVEKVEEALKAIEYPGVETVQIIFNMFRQRPAELFFEQAKKKNIGVIVRVPLASGLLTGKFSAESKFDSGDHRNFNREGQAFDRGETFSGVDFATGLEAVDELRNQLPVDGATLAQLALRWILMFDAVSCIIPGASRPKQAAENIEAASLAPLSGREMEAVRRVYDEKIRNPVHHLW
jgi:aryl-alcohol dehydrogenase-like predicted oxidoreductase